MHLAILSGALLLATLHAVTAGNTCLLRIDESGLRQDHWHCFEDSRPIQDTLYFRPKKQYGDDDGYGDDDDKDGPSGQFSLNQLRNNDRVVALVDPRQVVSDPAQARQARQDIEPTLTLANPGQELDMQQLIRRQWQQHMRANTPTKPSRSFFPTGIRKIPRLY